MANDLRTFDASKKKGLRRDHNDINETEQSRRDYVEYRENLRRVHTLMGDGALRGGKAVHIFQEPELGRDGRVTVWRNFHQCARSLGRTPKHISSFLYVELGMKCEIGGNGHLTIASRVWPEQLKKLLSRYVSLYVICMECRRMNTTLKKESRRLFVIFRDGMSIDKSIAIMAITTNSSISVKPPDFSEYFVLVCI